MTKCPLSHMYDHCGECEDYTQPCHPKHVKVQVIDNVVHIKEKPKKLCWNNLDQECEEERCGAWETISEMCGFKTVAYFKAHEVRLKERFE